MMWVTRLDRVRDFVNQAYMEFVGGSREEVQKLDNFNWIHPDDVERIVERVRARMPGADLAQVRDIARRLLERLGG